PPGAPAQAVMAKLITETSAAIARQVLMQAASAPATPRAPGKAAPAQWLFEIPLATLQGAAVAQFEIDRDGGHAGRDDDQRIWRARFSLDLDPMGPVHAKISLSAGHAHVVLWAEDKQTLSQLSRQQG